MDGSLWFDEFELVRVFVYFHENKNGDVVGRPRMRNWWCSVDPGSSPHQRCLLSGCQ